MLEFFYCFLHNYVDRRDFECIYMDTDLAYFATTGECLRDVVKPELLKVYGKLRKIGLQLAIAMKHLIEHQTYLRLNLLLLKLLLQLVSPNTLVKVLKQSGINWKRYMQAFQGYLEKAKNVGFRLYKQVTVRYKRIKFGLLFIILIW